MSTLRVLGLWLHLLAVVVWVGSTVGWILVLLSEGASEESADRHRRTEILGRRIYTVGWEAIFVIVLTGIFNLLPRVESGRLIDPDYYTPLIVKLSLLLGMIALQAWQHGWLVSSLGAEEANEGSRSRARRGMLVASCLLVALGAGALWVGVSLRF